MGIYDPIHQVGMWDNTLNGDLSSNIVASTFVEVDTSVSNKSEYSLYESADPLGNITQANRMSDKVQKRLAQNREAARKSRLRKKAYVQQLETCRLKLTQLEQELNRARQQGVYIGDVLNTGHVGQSAPLNSVKSNNKNGQQACTHSGQYEDLVWFINCLIHQPGNAFNILHLFCTRRLQEGIATFEMEYGHWVVEQQRQNCELRKVLQAHISDIELHMLVETCLNHYYTLFRMKADAAKADVFYLVSGTWRTSVERFFLWLGGFRPSELLNILMPQLEPLTDQQLLAVNNLRQSSQQAEDALSQGIDRLQQTLAQNIIADPATVAGNYSSHMASAMENLDALENFVNQADHLRQQTLQHIARILTVRQAAQGLLALGEYFQRLRALSSLWAARPREPA